MAHFSGTHVQNFDSKGRVSVPALFRAALREDSETASARTAAGERAIGIPLVLRPSEKAPCIEGWTENRFSALSAQLEQFEPMSDDYDALATVIYGDAYPLETDREGRVIIPEALLDHACIARADSAAFLGLGTRFQIWEPARVPGQKSASLAALRVRQARERAPS